MIIKIIGHIKTSWFWIIVVLFLIVFFTSNGHPIIQTFYFISFLLPVIIGTSYYVNEVLIPEYLIRGKNKEFFLYIIYTIIVSLYLQYLILFLALYIFTCFQFEGHNIQSINISDLSLSLYIFVLIKVLIEIIRKLNQKETQIQELQKKQELKKEQKVITVRYSRTNHIIELSEILFIESLSDYIKIVTEETVIITKEKISSIQERLPLSYIRTHRSFIVNAKKISSYNKEYLTLGDQQIPISRTYKSAVLSFLEKVVI